MKLRWPGQRDRLATVAAWRGLEDSATASLKYAEELNHKLQAALTKRYSYPNAVWDDELECDDEYDPADEQYDIEEEPG